MYVCKSVTVCVCVCSAGVREALLSGPVHIIHPFHPQLPHLPDNSLALPLLLSPSLFPTLSVSLTFPLPPSSPSLPLWTVVAEGVPRLC